jgi:hypothetical protein
VALAREGTVEALMKGSLHTDELMGAVVDAATGLRTARRISHVFLASTCRPTRSRCSSPTRRSTSSPTWPTRPTSSERHRPGEGAGMAEPKVAILAAVETVTPKMRATLDAAALCKMADRGQIAGGVLDGPLAFDNAISLVAAAPRASNLRRGRPGRHPRGARPRIRQHAGQAARVPGRGADAGVVLGARVPIVLTSRADTAETRAASCAIALLGAQPRLKARDGQGAVLAELTFAELAGLPADEQHSRTLDVLVRWLDEHDEGWQVGAVGHRVVHGADRYAAPVTLSPADVDALAGFIPLAPLHQPHNLAGIRALTGLLPGCRRWPASTPPSTCTSPKWRSRFALPRRCRTGASSATASTASPTNTSPTCCRSTSARRPTAASSSPTSATAPRCAPCANARASPRRWASPPLDGLMMGTRCGAIDPGVLLYLMEFEDGCRA